MVNHIITQSVVMKIAKLYEEESLNYATIGTRLSYSESAIADAYRRYKRNGIESFRKDESFAMS